MSVKWLFALRVDRLKEVRESKGFSQRELARRCGLAAIMINRYESGKADPALTNLLLIAEQLSVSTDYLLGLADEPYGQLMHSDLDPNELDMVEAYRREGWPGALRLIADRLDSK